MYVCVCVCVFHNLCMYLLVVVAGLLAIINKTFRPIAFELRAFCAACSIAARRSCRILTAAPRWWRAEYVRTCGKFDEPSIESDWPDSFLYTLVYTQYQN